MYAISATGYRAVAAGEALLPGEVLSEAVPQSLLDSLASRALIRGTVASTLQQQAEAALADLRAFRDLTTPTNAQTAAIVGVLVRVAIGTIKLAQGKLDSAV